MRIRNHIQHPTSQPPPPPWQVEGAGRLGEGAPGAWGPERGPPPHVGPHSIHLSNLVMANKSAHSPLENLRQPLLIYSRGSRTEHQ